MNNAVSPKDYAEFNLPGDQLSAGHLSGPMIGGSTTGSPVMPNSLTFLVLFLRLSTKKLYFTC